MLSSKTFSLLGTLEKECSQNDWDTEGAKAISFEVFQRTRNFLRNFSLENDPFISPCADDSLILSWEHPLGKISVEIGCHLYGAHCCYTEWHEYPSEKDLINDLVEMFKSNDPNSHKKCRSSKRALLTQIKLRQKELK